MGSEVESSIYPVYTKGTAVYSDDPRDYICYVCPEKQTEPLGHHLKDKNHLTRFASFSQCMVHVASVVYNKMAPKTIDFGRIVESSLTDVVPEGAPEFLFKNYISKRGIQYFCHLCKVKLPFWFVVESHIRDSKHQALRNERIDNSFLQNLSCPSGRYERGVNNSIFMKTEHSMFCYLCEIDVEPTHKRIRGHIRMKCHVEQLLKHMQNSGNFLDTVEGLSNDNNNNSTSENQETKDMTLCPELNSPVVDGERKKRVSFCTENNCIIDIGDDADLIDAHEDGEIQLESPQVHEDDEILGENNEDLTSGNVNNVIRSDDEGNQVPKRVVEAAKIDVPSPTVLDTIEQIPKVPQNLPEVIIQGEDNRYTCSVCKCLLPNLVSVKEHLKGARHLRKALLLAEGIVPPLPRGMIPLPNTLKTAEPLLKEIIHSHDTWKNGLEHLWNARDPVLEEIVHPHETSKNAPPEMIQLSNTPETAEPLPKGIIQGEDNKYTCSLCGRHDMPDLMTVKHHLNGVRHLRNALLLPEEIIQDQDGNYTCSLCRCHGMSDLLTVKEHLYGTRHLRNAQVVSEGIFSPQNTPENAEPLPKEIVQGLNGYYTCSLCGTYGMSDLGAVKYHLSGPRHLRNAQLLPEETIPPLDTVETLPEEIIQGLDGNYTCSLCGRFGMPDLVAVKYHLNGGAHWRNSQLLPEEMMQHYDTANNSPALPEVITLDQNNNYRCHLCGCHEMPDMATLNQHLNSYKHLRNALLLEEGTIPPYDTSEDPPSLPEGIFPLEEPWLTCLLCQRQINGEENIRKHVEGVQHQEAVTLQHHFQDLLNNPPPVSREMIHPYATSTNASPLREGIIHLDDNWLICLLCQCHINGEENIRHHVLGVQHQEAKILQLERFEAEKSRERWFNKTATKLSPECSTLSVGSLQKKGNTGYSFEGIVEIEGTDLISCAVCDNFVFNLADDGLIGHLNGRTHRSNLAKVLGNLRS